MRNDNAEPLVDASLFPVPAYWSHAIDHNDGADRVKATHAHFRKLAKTGDRPRSYAVMPKAEFVTAFRAQYGDRKLPVGFVESDEGVSGFQNREEARRSRRSGRWIA